MFKGLGLCSLHLLISKYTNKNEEGVIHTSSNKLSMLNYLIPNGLLRVMVSARGRWVHLDVFLMKSGKLLVGMVPRDS